MQINSWNCRGLGNLAKVEAVKDLLKMYPSDFLLLQETKIEEDSILSISKSKWKKNVGLVVSSRGSYGGMATIWSEDIFHLKNSFRTQQWIYSELYHISSNLSIYLINLYVLVYYVEKKFVGSLC